MSKKEELFNGGWMLLIIFCTFVCIMMIILFPFEKNGYQEECVQSHVEDTAVYVYENKYVNSTREFVPHNDKVISIHREMKEVCDKYALVRYTNEVKE